MQRDWYCNKRPFPRDGSHSPNTVPLEKTGGGIDQFDLTQRITYLRERRNLTQSELAAAAGVSQSTIAHIENGKKDPSLSTPKKISHALGVHIAILFASDNVHVFDMKNLKSKYDHVDKLNPTLYYALGRVLDYARDIGFKR